VLIAPTPDNQAPRFLTEGELKNLTEDPQGSYGVTEFLSGVPENPDPNYWGEGKALLMRVRFATLEPIETVTKYEVRLEG
jgi:hypothetical protein